jgi:hypothetical protein
MHDRHGRARRRLAQRQVDGVAEAGAVGQAGEAVAVGEPQDLRLVLGDALAHPLERLRQLADLVVAPRLRHRRRVVAAAEALGGVGQPAQRRRHPARGDDAAEREDDDADQRDRDQRELQVAREPHGVVDRQRQERAHARAAVAAARPLSVVARTPSSSPWATTEVIARRRRRRPVLRQRRRGRRCRGWSGSPTTGRFGSARDSSVRSSADRLFRSLPSWRRAETPSGPSR